MYLAQGKMQDGSHQSTQIIPLAKYYFDKVANCHLKHIPGSHIHKIITSQHSCGTISNRRSEQPRAEDNQTQRGRMSIRKQYLIRIPFIRDLKTKLVKHVTKLLVTLTL